MQLSTVIKEILNPSDNCDDTGAKFPSAIMLHDLHFFIPYFPGKGIRDVYEITGVRTITGRDAKQLEGTDSAAEDIRLAFELSYSRSLTGDFLKIKTSGMIKDTFIDTPFEDLSNSFL